MQYIWEVVLAAEKNGIREADLRYEVAEVRSPYLEVSFCDLNTQTVEQTVVEVNPFYRFFDIFSGVLDINQKEYKIVKLLGHGKGGYSYLAEREGKFYVLKQIHHEPCEYYSFGNKIEAEQNDYNRLLQTGIRIPRMLDIDVANERILKEYIDYECNNYMDEWNFENWGIKYWSKTTEFIDYMEQHWRQSAHPGI